MTSHVTYSKAMQMLGKSHIYMFAINSDAVMMLITEYGNSADKTGKVKWRLIEALHRGSVKDVASAILDRLNSDAEEFVKRQEDANVPMFIKRAAS